MRDREKMVKFKWVQFLSEKTWKTKREEDHYNNCSLSIEKMIINGNEKNISDQTGDTSRTCWEKAIRKWTEMRPVAELNEIEKDSL